MKIQTFIFNPFYENSIVISSNENNAIIVDPGCYEKYEIEEITNYIVESGLTVVGVYNTHCHIDHVLGNKAMKEKFGVRFFIPINEQPILKAQEVYAQHYGIQNYDPAEVDEFLKEGDIVELDELSFELIEVPGHSPGHMVFYEKNEETLIGGDVLFKESIGRTDLPGGNHADLVQNIQEKVYSLPESTVVYPGHGPTTTIGHEKKNNPFVKG